MHEARCQQGGEPVSFIVVIKILLKKFFFGE